MRSRPFLDGRPRRRKEAYSWIDGESIMTGWSDKDWLDDFARRVRKLMEEVVAESGEAVDWEMLPISANDRHPNIVVNARGARRQFQIDQEEQALGTSDEQIKVMLRGHLRFALIG
jgi:short-subunit dehydrogenase involved in D-alanine esterification of teichoic acids